MLFDLSTAAGGHTLGAIFPFAELIVHFPVIGVVCEISDGWKPHHENEIRETDVASNMLRHTVHVCLGVVLSGVLLLW